MNKLFLIDGASGTGTSDLINLVKNDMRNDLSINVISKYTTRKKRMREEAKETELIFVNDEDFSKYSDDYYYTYQYGNANYSFSKNELINSVSNYEFTFVIVRNKSLIDRLKNELKNIAIVIHVFIYTDGNLARKRLINEGFSEKQIEFRLNRIESVWNDYMSYDEDVYTIINNSNISDFHRKIRKMITRYSQKNEPNNKLFISPCESFDLINSLIGYKESMEKALRKYPYNKNVFLMMKFRDSNKEVYEYIKKRLKEKNLNCVRADQAEWNLTANVYNPLAVLYCCKYGIALFDEADTIIKDKNDNVIKVEYNPNVSYELGIMHYQKKKCLILKHSSLSEVPFDLIKDLYKSYAKEIEIESIINDWLKSINI